VKTQAEIEQAIHLCRETARRSANPDWAVTPAWVADALEWVLGRESTFEELIHRLKRLEAEERGAVANGGAQ
jgi:hypothetical protein